MNATQIIEIMGGRARVMKLTGLTKGRISQWAKEDHIPKAWMLAFHRMKPRQIPSPAVERPKKPTPQEQSHA
ncbi:hypothetical protein BBB39_13130 [Bordetella trematum]|uniref:Uncharacterized protein n=1 Tax=Bordetella trematum TaxID=123899 RepID=A0A157STY4_9BORD|nr:hypothetical protein [Bordetella trematum]AZR94615.1 hypothetical protein BBB39_13130 [Bordetella trematum]NNH19110.1 hypothetical protein [Bordetella trematum]SAI58494.1 Uncharacterised protein [Bordetella trematum]SAI73918.1 Uncharacterised protein [Bordetella trematum]SUV97141.1 Uncharacterised protein [Bordetella trematum]